MLSISEQEAIKLTEFDKADDKDDITVTVLSRNKASKTTQSML